MNLLLALLGKAAILISSPAFTNNGLIPQQFTCEGNGSNPPLSISGIPEGTKSLVLIVEDPDATKGTFDHWIVWNIPPAQTINENSVPGVEGKNGAGKTGYTGPCPPTGKHRYFFKIYALNAMLDLKAGANKHEVEAAMKSHVLAQGQLIGLYQKQK